MRRVALRLPRGCAADPARCHRLEADRGPDCVHRRAGCQRHSSPRTLADMGLDADGRLGPGLVREVRPCATRANTPLGSRLGHRRTSPGPIAEPPFSGGGAAVWRFSSSPGSVCASCSRCQSGQKRPDDRYQCLCVLYATRGIRSGPDLRDARLPGASR